jgi:hypothetical protein
VRQMRLQYRPGLVRQLEQVTHDVLPLRTTQYEMESVNHVSYLIGSPT